MKEWFTRAFRNPHRAFAKKKEKRVFRRRLVAPTTDTRHRAPPPCRAHARTPPNPVRKTKQVDISEGGTIPASALKKITAGGDGVGLRCYDNG